MPHGPDEQLIPVGWFGRAMGQVFTAFFVLAIPVAIAAFVIYSVKFN